MRFVGFAAGFAAVGAALSCGAAWWAASQWTSFSDYWLYSTGFVPSVGAILGAWKASAKDAWPPPRPMKFALAGVSAVLAGLSSYVAFALVSNTWNPVAAGPGDFIGLLFSPSEVPEIYSRRGGSGSGFAQGPLLQFALGAGVGIFVPLAWLRQSGAKA